VRRGLSSSTAKDIKWTSDITNLIIGSVRHNKHPMECNWMCYYKHGLWKRRWKDFYHVNRSWNLLLNLLISWGGRGAGRAGTQMRPNCSGKPWVQLGRIWGASSS
jgi:hypothetical protein